LKFGDVVTAVASIAVILALIAAPLDIVLVSALGLEMAHNASLVYFLLAPLIIGYIYAGKIWEARRETITKITVLWTALVWLVVLILPGASAYWGQMAKEEYLAMNPGATLSTSEWVAWEMVYLDVYGFIVIAVVLVFGFIGLYIGSMLRKPKKS